MARFRLRIEGVQLRRAAVQPNLDDRLGLGLAALRPSAAAEPAGQQQSGRAAEAAPHGLAPGDRLRLSRRDSAHAFIGRAYSVFMFSLCSLPIS